MTDRILKSKPRALFATAIFLFLLLSLSALIYISEQLLTIFERFQQLSLSYAIGIPVLVFLFAFLIGWIIFRIVFPKSRSLSETETDETSQTQIESRIEHARSEGVVTKKLEENFSLLNTRQTTQQIYIALFGEINVGKTAIISALLPDIQLQSQAVGGSTKTIKQYSWKVENTELIISDLPGTDQTNGSHTANIARQEAIHAHIVIYVCDGDINKQQYAELLKILTLNKPTIVVINKMDQYSDDEKEKVLQRLRERINNQSVQSIVQVHSGGFENILSIDASGNEKMIERLLPVDVSALKVAIQQVLLDKKGELNSLRDHAVLHFISEQLNVAEKQLKDDQAHATVSQYTRKAVVGALAAVSPGTDVIIQAYLGTSMVKEICAIYQIKISNFDVNTLLKLVQNQVGRLLPLILTITGNALKAFPGIGTLAGGLIHAVAYGLIFEALGKSMIKTLSQQPDLKPAETAKIFQEMLSGNMEKNTTNIIKLVLQEKSKKSEFKQ